MPLAAALAGCAVLVTACPPADAGVGNDVLDQEDGGVSVLDAGGAQDAGSDDAGDGGPVVGDSRGLRQCADDLCLFTPKAECPFFDPPHGFACDVSPTIVCEYCLRASDAIYITYATCVGGLWDIDEDQGICEGFGFPPQVDAGTDGGEPDEDAGVVDAGEDAGDSRTPCERAVAALEAFIAANAACEEPADCAVLSDVAGSESCDGHTEPAEWGFTVADEATDDAVVLRESVYGACTQSDCASIDSSSPLVCSPFDVQARGGATCTDGTCAIVAPGSCLVIDAGQPPVEDEDAGVGDAGHDDGGAADAGDVGNGGKTR